MTRRRGNAWSWTTGERGASVRLFTHPKSGLLYVQWRQRERDGRVVQRSESLGHTDREAGKTHAEDLARQLRTSRSNAPTDRLTLRELFDRYERTITPTKSRSARSADRGAFALFLKLWGDDRRAITLTGEDVRAFVEARRSGALRLEKSKRAKVRNRSIQQHLSCLRAALRWATVTPATGGGYLLSKQPLNMVKFPREKEPKRPLLSSEEYEMLREVAPRISRKFEVALVLAHETGHRLSSIRQLRWCDVFLDERRVHWPADADKCEYAHDTVMTEAAFEALSRWRRERPAVGDALVLPSDVRPGEPICRYVYLDWWREAERAAKLARVPGRGWHSLRRNFATSLLDAPLKAVMALGGWKDSKTLIECYQQPDLDAQRVALEQRRRVGTRTTTARATG